MDDIFKNKKFVDLSIIIVNWNTKYLLRNCLSSLLNNLDNDLNCEVIVVDNGSSDGSSNMVKKEFPSVFLIENEDNVGFVRGNNQGAEKATGRHLLLLNSDTIVLDNGIKKIINYLDTRPEVGIVTGKVLYPDWTFQRPFAKFPHWVGAIFRNTTHLVTNMKTPFHKKFRLQHLDETKEHNVDWVFGAYLFIRRTLLDNGKVFDEDIYMWSEDTLLCYRIRAKGYQINYLPYAPIIHYAGESRRKVPSDSAYNSFKGSVLYFEKIKGKNLAKFYSFSVRLIWGILAVTFTILNFIPAKKFTEKAHLFRNLLSRGPVL